MKIRKLIPRLVTGLAACMAAHHLNSANVAGTGIRPNILIISIDDQNDWVGPLGGYPKAKTPNWDRLAAMAQTFTNAHAATPLCNPSRTSILYGIRPSTSGIYQNKQPADGSAVLKDAVSMAEDLRRQGYKTMNRGKALGGGRAGSWDYNQGRQPELGPPQSQRPINGWDKTHDWVPLNVATEDMPDWKNAEWAAEQLSGNHGRPFFISVGTVHPHIPWDAPKKFYDLHPLDEIVLPDVKAGDIEDIPAGAALWKKQAAHQQVLEKGIWRRAIQGYLASSSFADACLGRMLDALEHSPHRDNTIVIVFGDHGYHLGEKGQWGKMTPWEESTRAPFMWIVPGLTKAGSRCDAPVTLMDIYATIVELCGLEQRPHLESVSLARLLKDPRETCDRPALSTVFFKNHTLRSREWRYTRYADGTEELYNHVQDPNEWANLAGDHRHDRIKQELSKWLPTVNAAPAPQSKAGGDADNDDEPVVRKRKKGQP